MGESPEALLTSLLLLREHLSSAILKTISLNQRASPESLYQILSEVECLLASATQEAAALIPGSSATPFDDWIYTGRTIGTRGVMVPKSASQWSRRHVSGGAACQRTIHRPSGARETLYFDLPTGNLWLHVNVASHDPNDVCTSEQSGLFFVPSPAVGGLAVDARFLKVSGEGLEPRLNTQLNAFYVVTDLSEQCFDLIHDGTLEEIDTALRKGAISPYHISEHGVHWWLWVS